MSDARFSKGALIAALRHGPARRLAGLAGIKTRWRPLICPLEQVLSAVPEGARVYDIGCGTGSLLYLAATLRGAAAAHGYDISAATIEAAQLFAPGLPAFRAALMAAEETPPPLEGYDAVAMVDVLHHIPPARQTGFLDAVVRGMDRDAWLILADINPERRLRALCNQLHDLALAREWVHPISPATVAPVIAAAGATIIAERFVTTLWYAHYLIIARKNSH